MAKKKDLKEEKYKPVHVKKADLSKLKHPILKELIDAGIINEWGIRVQGIGVIINKIDKTNLKLWGLSKDIQKAFKLKQKK